MSAWLYYTKFRDSFSFSRKERIGRKPPRKVPRKVPRCLSPDPLSHSPRKENPGGACSESHTRLSPFGQAAAERPDGAHYTKIPLTRARARRPPKTAAESAAVVAHHSGSGRVSPSAFFLRRSSASALRFSSRSRFLSPASSNETV